MKKILLITSVAGFVIFMVSCKKENTKNKEGVTGITGTWELRRAQGMLTTNYSSGNGNILKFTDDNYEAYSNGQLLQSGIYTIVPDSTVSEEICLFIEPGQYTQRIIYDGAYIDNKKFVQVSGDELSFVSGCFAYDGGTFTIYKRQ